MKTNKMAMKDSRLEEFTDGLMEQFRIVRDRGGDTSEEIKIADSLANMYGKVLKGYATELAYFAVGQRLPCENAPMIEAPKGK
jgi:hypothetical protein